MGQQNDYVRRIKNVRKQWPECSDVNTKLNGILVCIYYDEIAFTSLLLVPMFTSKDTWNFLATLLSMPFVPRTTFPNKKLCALSLCGVARSTLSRLHVCVVSM